VPSPPFENGGVIRFGALPAMQIHAVYSFINALAEPVEVTDADGVLVAANAAAAARFGSEKDLGLPLAERLGRRAVLTPDGRGVAASEHPVGRVLAHRAPVFGVRLVLETTEGRVGHVVNVAPLWEGTRLAGTVSLAYPAPAPARLEQEIADHAARLAAIVDLVSEAVLVVTDGDVVVFSNAVGVRLLGDLTRLGVEERARRLALRTLDGVPVPADRYPARRALGGESFSGLELLVRSASGEDRRVVIGAHPLRDGEGVVYAAILTLQDVTSEAAARADLERARAAAEEANRLKDDFIAALSHELRAPLQPILGWTEVLRRREDLDEVAVRALDAIRRNVRHQVRLVDDLLDLSRIAHGELALRFERFDLRDPVRAAVEPLEEAAALKRVRLTLRLPPDPVPMWTDGSRVEQIASRLTANAIELASPGNTVTVRVGAERPAAIIEVEGEGVGTAGEDLDLLLVRHVAALLHGEMEVAPATSDPGRVRVRLPLTTPPGARTAAGRGSHHRLGHRSILVIEDNDDTRDVLRFMLELEGARVETAAAGLEGVETATAFQPDVVLCDIGLPDIDGFEVARRIRARVAAPSPRLIALTGYGQAEAQRQAGEAGFEAHLTKPVNLDELLALLGAEGS
jgi:signal transduction histidine kinase